MRRQNRAVPRVGSKSERQKAQCTEETSASSAVSLLRWRGAGNHSKACSPSGQGMEVEARRLKGHHCRQHALRAPGALLGEGME